MSLNVSEAHKCYLMASSRELHDDNKAVDPRGQFLLGFTYEKGEGVQENKEMARLWYKEAAEHDIPEALIALVLQNENAKSWETSMMYHERLATLGDAFAQYKVGFVLTYGNQVSDVESRDRAISLFMKSSQKGHIGSLFELGLWKEYLGESSEALQLYMQASKHNSLDADYAVARHWFFQDLHPKDVELCLKHAAKQSHLESLLLLAEIQTESVKAEVDWIVVNRWNVVDLKKAAAFRHYMLRVCDQEKSDSQHLHTSPMLEQANEQRCRMEIFRRRVGFFYSQKWDLSTKLEEQLLKIEWVMVILSLEKIQPPVSETQSVKDEL